MNEELRIPGHFGSSLHPFLDRVELIAQEQFVLHELVGSWVYNHAHFGQVVADVWVAVNMVNKYPRRLQSAT